jgi:hypothetical protein
MSDDAEGPWASQEEIDLTYRLTVSIGVMIEINCLAGRRLRSER